MEDLPNPVVVKEVRQPTTTFDSLPTPVVVKVMRDASSKTSVREWRSVSRVWRMMVNASVKTLESPVKDALTHFPQLHTVRIEGILAEQSDFLRCAIETCCSLQELVFTNKQKATEDRARQAVFSQWLDIITDFDGNSRFYWGPDYREDLGDQCITVHLIHHSMDPLPPAINMTLGAPYIMGTLNLPPTVRSLVLQHAETRGVHTGCGVDCSMLQELTMINADVRGLKMREMRHLSYINTGSNFPFYVKDWKAAPHLTRVDIQDNFMQGQKHQQMRELYEHCKANNGSVDCPLDMSEWRARKWEGAVGVTLTRDCSSARPVENV